MYQGSAPSCALGLSTAHRTVAGSALQCTWNVMVPGVETIAPVSSAFFQLRPSTTASWPFALSIRQGVRNPCVFLETCANSVSSSVTSGCSSMRGAMIAFRRGFDNRIIPVFRAVQASFRDDVGR